VQFPHYSAINEKRQIVIVKIHRLLGIFRRLVLFREKYVRG
jgi:hypothetical protein